MAETGNAGSASGADTTDRADWIRSLLERHEGPLLRYAARITGDLERAQDVVQDTFLKLCKQEREDVEGHAVEWLFTVCRNRALDVRRKERRMKTLGESKAAESCASGESAPAEILERGETASRILQIFGTLSENQQEVLRLKFQGGLSYKEISRVTDLTVSNVGFLIHTGLKTIRTRLQVQTDSGMPSRA